jgi:hypothetical protein
MGFFNKSEREEALAQPAEDAEEDDYEGVEEGEERLDTKSVKLPSDKN